MGFRVSKSIKLAPGVRMTVSKSGLGYSVGGKGMRVTRHAGGRVTRTASIPGTGISHSSTIRQAPRKSTSPRSTPRSTAVLPPPIPPARPGVLAPGWEKDLHRILDSRQPADFVAAAQKHGGTVPEARFLAAALEGLLHYQFRETNQAAQDRARALLGWVVAQNAPLAQSQFVTKYLADRTWPVEIAFGITAHLRLGDDVVRLAAAELHQAAGDLPAAIWTVENANPTTPAALSLTELYSDANRHQDVIDTTNGITNEDDATTLLLALRGRAFAHQGFHDAARESFKEALRVRTRSTEVRHRALLERAQVNLAQNRKAAARKDIEKVLAEDPHYPGLNTALTELD
jgi:tetratricopeptide (TPR) repeat protein